jgi:hypothetical protein
VFLAAGTCNIGLSRNKLSLSHPDDFALAMMKELRMASRTARESKAESTHVTAMKIIAAEQKQQQVKTARLRKLRLARLAEADKNDK